MTQSQEQARVIAEGLTEAQRGLLLKLPQRASLIGGAPGQALFRKGLATLKGRARFRLFPTDTGLAVRNILTGDPK